MSSRHALRLSSALLLVALAALQAIAEAPAPEPSALSQAEQAEYERLVALDSSLAYQTGRIELADGLATLDLPDSLRFLVPESTERLLVEGWGNPDGAGTLGMIVPGDMSPLAAQGWGVVITYEEEGHVADEDADSIDYDALLAEMKASAVEDNRARAEQGFARVELVGWAEPPRYDAENKKLYWAKELAFEGSPSNTLNYNVRVLGRRGVLTLNAVAGMSQLEKVQGVMPAVIAAAEFNAGHRYADFDPKSDQVAAYGLAALVAGGIAAKSGLFAKLFAVAVSFKKLVVPAVVALVVGVGAWWRKRGTDSSA